MKSIHEIISEFDAIAGALRAGTSRALLTPAEGALLRHVPATARTALDVGCGAGLVARTLEHRGLRVLALDVSPEMIALARAKTPTELDVEYRVADFMAEAVPPGGFDVVISVNVVHHFPLSDIVPRLASGVAPGGLLLIQDVVTRSGARYLVRNVAAALSRRIAWLRSGYWPSRSLTSLYARHGDGEVYLTPNEAQSAFDALLPNVHVEHHL